jgi:hypothetical protein
MAGDSFAVVPQELVTAAGTLRSVQAELATESVSGVSGTGTGVLDAALAAFSARLGFVAAAMDDAIGATALNLVAGAEGYSTTDATQFRGEGEP